MRYKRSKKHLVSRLTKKENILLLIKNKFIYRIRYIDFEVYDNLS